MIETALEQLLVGTNHGEGLHIADLADDAGSRERTSLIVQLKRLGEFPGVADLEQVDVLRIPQIVHAHAARRALQRSTMRRIASIHCCGSSAQS